MIGATHRNLRTMVERGTFSEDLFYRLHIFTIGLPPLRERPDDVLPLAEALLEDIGRQLGRRAAGLSREAAPRLLAYHWPGNVRELRNVLERAAILAGGGLIASEHLALPAHGAAADRHATPPVGRLHRPRPSRGRPLTAGDAVRRRARDGSAGVGAGPATTSRGRRGRSG